LGCRLRCRLRRGWTSLGRRLDALDLARLRARFNPRFDAWHGTWLDALLHSWLWARSRRFGPHARRERFWRASRRLNELPWLRAVDAGNRRWRARLGNDDGWLRLTLHLTFRSPIFAARLATNEARVDRLDCLARLRITGARRRHWLTPLRANDG
jgi:hypothetical protein